MQTLRSLRAAAQADRSGASKHAFDDAPPLAPSGVAARACAGTEFSASSWRAFRDADLAQVCDEFARSGRFAVYAGHR